MFSSHTKHILPTPTSLSTCRDGWWITSPIPQMILQFDLIISTLRGRLFPPPLSLGCSWTLFANRTWWEWRCEILRLPLWGPELLPSTLGMSFAGTLLPCYDEAQAAMWRNSDGTAPAPSLCWMEPVIRTTVNHVRTFWKLLSSQHFIWHQ